MSAKTDGEDVASYITGEAMDRWTDGLKAFLLVVRKIGAEVQPLRVLPPAKEEVLAMIERQVGLPIPESYRMILARYSACVDFRWQLPDRTELPHEVRQIFAGGLYWDDKQIVQTYEGYQGWLTNCFSNPDNEYDRVWHGKFPVLHVPNGDMIGIETAGEHKGAVVYLSHDGADLHGYRLGNDFEDFVDRYIALGCPGPEEWQLEPFLPNSTSGIQIDCPNARLWLSFVLNSEPPSRAELDAFNVSRERERRESLRQFHLRRLAESDNPAERLGTYIADPELALNAGISKIYKELERIPRENRGSVAAALKPFHNPSALDWIEQNVPAVVTEEWGRLAAASSLSWSRIRRWLDTGRPLSLVAIDALKHTAVRDLPDAPPLEHIEAALSGYAKIDAVPKVTKAVQAILAGLNR